MSQNNYKFILNNYSLYVLIILGFAACSPSLKKEVHLFRILENDKYGFIDVKGRVVIAPKFLSADNFSEGLANARVSGTYGYIDTTGAFVIPPQFDYATPFSEGLAIVYKEGLPFFIDRKGQQVFANPYKELEPFKNGRAKVQTASKKFGFINTKGQLIIDTVFISIGPFINSRAVVDGEIKDPLQKKNKTEYGTGVIDTLGKFVIPYGLCKSIADIEGGYFRIETVAEPWDTLEGYSSMDGYYDRNGNIVFAKKYHKDFWLDGDMHDGLAIIQLYKYWNYEPEGTTSSVNMYEGYIDMEGDIVINNPRIETAFPFHEGRAFIEDVDENYFMIDRKGQLVTKDTFNGIVGEGFENGIAAVRKGIKYGIINTDGEFVLKPKFEGISNLDVKNGTFFFEIKNLDKRSRYYYHYGIANLKGDTLVKPFIQTYDYNGFVNGLLLCQINNKLSYVNRKGNIVWQAIDTLKKGLDTYTVDFMTPGYFEVHTKEKGYEANEFSRFQNFPIPITTKQNFLKNNLSVVVTCETAKLFFHNFKCWKVYLANSTKNNFSFQAQDGRLNMKVQAKDTKGRWRDIEWLPNSTCGNSYHDIELDANHYWSLATLQYVGDFKTKLRIELQYIDPSDPRTERYVRKQITIYSNEYDGSVNPAQFWRTKEYFSSNLMDPY